MNELTAKSHRETPTCRWNFILFPSSFSLSSESTMSLRLKPLCISQRSPPDSAAETAAKQTRFDLGNGSDVVYMPRFLSSDKSWELFDYLDAHIPWTRPNIRVFGRSCVQVIDLSARFRHPFVSSSHVSIWFPRISWSDIMARLRQRECRRLLLERFWIQ